MIQPALGVRKDFVWPLCEDLLEHYRRHCNNRMSHSQTPSYPQGRQLQLDARRAHHLKGQHPEIEEFFPCLPPSERRSASTGVIRLPTLKHIIRLGGRRCALVACAHVHAQPSAGEQMAMRPSKQELSRLPRTMMLSLPIDCSSSSKQELSRLPRA